MSKLSSKKRQKSTVFDVIVIIILSIIALMQIFPFYLQIVTSLQPLDFLPDPGHIYITPVSISIGNYLESIRRVGLMQGLFNSIIVAGGYTLLSAVVILIVGYVLEKKQFRGKKAIKFMLLLTMVVPGEMLMVSNYNLVSELGWTNTFAGLILPGIVNITGIFLVSAFMNTIPNAVLESADIDGANEITKLFKIVLPLTLPVIATYCILTFVAQWNDYLWPMIITNDSNLFTLQLKLKEFNPYYEGYADEILKSAAFTMTIVPVVIVYLINQKRFVSGLSITGMK